MAEYKLFAKRRGLSAHAGNKETKLPPTIHVWSEEESEDDEDVITPKVQGKDWIFLTIWIDLEFKFQWPLNFKLIYSK